MSRISLTKDLYPNFLIVGTAKAATTTIHEYLKQHPEILMSNIKEPCFFIFKDQKNIEYSTGRKVNFINNIEEYQKLFSSSNNVKIKGESSTPYMYFYKQTIDNIKATITNYSNVKILIVLRNPIERAYSQYMMKRRDLVENLSFEEALDTEKKRMKENAHFDFFYADRGLYYKQVKAYLENFDNVKIMLYEDLIYDMNIALNNIVSFLEVKDFSFKKVKNQNVSGISKFHFITEFIKNKSVLKKLIGKLVPNGIKRELVNKVQYLNTKKGKEINEKTRRRLIKFYSKDIMMLEDLINQDLKHWLR
jgi:hypothetical protein